VPSRRRRSRPTRAVARLLFVAVAVIGIGSVMAGTAPSPLLLAPVGMVKGAVGVPSVPGATPTLSPERFRPTDPPLEPAVGPAPPAELDGYQWPLLHARITLPFGPTPWGTRLVEGKQFHDGVDMATFCGDRIVAAHSGVVLAAGRKFDQEIGWAGSLTRYFDRLDAQHLWMSLPIVVVTDDGNGYRSIYAHFEKVVVKTGQTVRAGDLIGYEGRTGRASGCHLHYGLFSPMETGRIAIEPEVIKRMKVPAAQIARIDPLLVLPVRTTTPKLKAGSDPKASPSPSPAAAKSPHPTG
jgi:murein DD-endopeptidase MepM/ murein hydrolase activator NlpD